MPQSGVSTSSVADQRSAVVEPSSSVPVASPKAGVTRLVETKEVLLLPQRDESTSRRIRKRGRGRSVPLTMSCEERRVAALRSKFPCRLG